MMEFDDIRNWVVRCVRCGTCKYTGDTYLPSCPAGERFRFEPYFASGKNFIGRGILEGELSFADPELVKILYACTACGNCQTQCPLPQAEHLVDIYEALRARAVEKGHGPLPEHRSLLSSIHQYQNPWMQPRNMKNRWTRGRKIADISKNTSRVLYFVGCTASLDPALQNIPRATASLFEAAGVDFGILGSEEICCGSTALRIGDRQTFIALARKNADVFESLGAEMIVTSCAGCYRTLKYDYPGVVSLRPEILHSSELLFRLFSEGRISFRKEFPRTVTYHDPCHLGRLGGVFDPPRELIRSIPGITFHEMERIREHAYCCGAGGGVRTAFPDWATDNVVLRIQEAGRTGARTIISTCPFCYQNFSAGIARDGLSIEFVDLVELLARLI